MHGSMNVKLKKKNCEHNVIKISHSDPLVIRTIWWFGCSATKGLGGPAGLQPPTQKKKKLKKTTDFVDTVITVRRDLRFILNESLQSADDWNSETLKCIAQTYEYVDSFFIFISF
jgi:hypothetical protein